ncbi:MAG: hypothetical protein QG588_292, partial [Candidatus Poribacteria bacterium]|nr:hypothetical protein [Candidatus Poribacteria bacterium]
SDLILCPPILKKQDLALLANDTASELTPRCKSTYFCFEIYITIPYFLSVGIIGKTI